MAKTKITDEIYAQCKVEYDLLTEDIKRLQKDKEEYVKQIDKKIKEVRAERAKAKLNIVIYERRENNSNSYKQGLAYTVFGKRKKDLTKEELKEYNRLAHKRSNNKVDIGE